MKHLLVKRLSIVLLVALVLAALLVPSAAAASAETQTEPPQIPTLLEALRLLGTTVGAGMVISFLLAKVEWFKQLTGEKRFWTVLGLSMVIPLVATLLINLIPADVIVTLEPYWQAIAAGFIVFIGTQAQYALSQANKNQTVVVNAVTRTGGPSATIDLDNSMKR